MEFYQSLLERISSEREEQKRRPDPVVQVKFDQAFKKNEESKNSSKVQTRT